MHTIKQTEKLSKLIEKLYYSEMPYQKNFQIGKLLYLNWLDLGSSPCQVMKLIDSPSVVCCLKIQK